VYGRIIDSDTDGEGCHVYHGLMNTLERLKYLMKLTSLLAGHITNRSFTHNPYLSSHYSSPIAPTAFSFPVQQPTSHLAHFALDQIRDARASLTARRLRPQQTPRFWHIPHRRYKQCVSTGLSSAIPHATTAETRRLRKVQRKG